MDKKKICFFSGDITRGGGTERVATMIANALAAEGVFEIVFLSLTEQCDQPFFPLHPDIQRFACGKKWIRPGLGYLSVIPKVRRFLKQQKIDVIIDIDIVLDSLSLPASYGMPVKVLSWEHFNYVYENSSWYRRLILNYSARHSDYIVTLTEEDKKTYAEKLGRKERISTIYNPATKRPKIEPCAKENWLITVGHLTKLKGMDLLATTALTVLTRNPEWKWLIVGDGEEQSFLEHFIKQYGLENRLILTGRTQDVSQYLRKAQVYVMTSRLEGFGMSMLEAKEFSLPIVGFDVPTGPNEIISHGVNGLLIPPFDCDAMAAALEQLIRDDNLRRTYAANAQDDIEKFQIEKILREWNTVLDSLTTTSESQR